MRAEAARGRSRSGPGRGARPAPARTPASRAGAPSRPRGAQRHGRPRLAPRRRARPARARLGRGGHGRVRGDRPRRCAPATSCWPARSATRTARSRLPAAGILAGALRRGRHRGARRPDRLAAAGAPAQRARPPARLGRDRRGHRLGLAGVRRRRTRRSPCCAQWSAAASTRSAARSWPPPAAPARYRALAEAAWALDRWAETIAPRHVALAGPRASCAGVERAIEVVERALERHGAPVYVRRRSFTTGTSWRTSRGAARCSWRSSRRCPQGATTVLSAHGVAPERARGGGGPRARVIDATCPLVAKVHARGAPVRRRRARRSCWSATRGTTRSRAPPATRPTGSTSWRASRGGRSRSRSTTPSGSRT